MYIDICRKNIIDYITRLRDMSDELYRELSNTSLGVLSCIMHQHIDSTLISTFVER